MAEEWSDGETTYKVSELFAENQLLMDLSKQPDAVKDIINRCIDAEMEAHKKYNHFNFVKLCGSNGLQRIVESSNQYMKFLSA